jgi:hypothetical protein
MDESTKKIADSFWFPLILPLVSLICIGILIFIPNSHYFVSIFLTFSIVLYTGYSYYNGKLKKSRLISGIVVCVVLATVLLTILYS